MNQFVTFGHQVIQLFHHGFSLLQSEFEGYSEAYRYLIARFLRNRVRIKWREVMVNEGIDQLPERPFVGFCATLCNQPLQLTGCNLQVAIMKKRFQRQLDLLENEQVPANSTIGFV
ncbi:hypothetical protein Verru16b_02541 [Lacunisphaera limnophila]|uniref:Uncharacterized protein n=1 Tax=Lacunisphaera limnophila TaxID=1838286 RepID=A0A1D8AX60_9BACT|nr:hypothetical protein Verru16b_02541 [Lacunisphaera limnophila]